MSEVKSTEFTSKPSECEDSSIIGGQEGSYTYQTIKTNVRKCLTAYRNLSTSNDVIIGGGAGAGGLVCGLGLFPCICKLIAKLRG